ncbi:MULTISPECIES: hypothetical protein [unclassified Tatumella]|uniref:hypothetical protein n=1 Tax=unclassified Tatumella TaxID=2649542 RepID=UPI001BB0D511|nr:MULTISPECIES: hypothetical protein [unclassified Tatumella]MBS0855954.1 hypothetical protein [Tatumella sp. JGM16]MBS0912933.1 hypothetical protein [Tatumella sp. JGM91]
MTETTDLALLEIKPEQSPALYVQSGLDPYLEMIREMAKEVPDVTTKKGRDRIGSLAQAISRSKTAIEKPGRAYLKHLKEAVKPAEQELKRFVDECNSIRDSVLKVREEWDAEQQRLAEIEAMNTAHAEALEMNNAFDKAAAEKFESDHEIALLMNDKHDRDRAEAARLAEQQRIEHEQRIARETEERVKREAEEKAKRDREEAERRERELQAAAEKEKQERIAAEQRAEQQRIEAQQLAERQAREAREKAERDKREAREKAERDKREAIEAERRKAAQVELARLAEEKRIKDEADRRARDTEHRRNINLAAVSALVESGLTEDCAKACIKAIAKGQVPAVTINY